MVFNVDHVLSNGTVFDGVTAELHGTVVSSANGVSHVAESLDAWRDGKSVCIDDRGVISLHLMAVNPPLLGSNISHVSKGSVRGVLRIVAGSYHITNVDHCVIETPFGKYDVIVGERGEGVAEKLVPHEMCLEVPSIVAEPTTPPLVYWAAVGNLEHVEEALKSGANVNAAEVDGYSALHAAAENGWKEIVRLLVKSGANVSAGCNGRTAADLAATAGHHEIVRDLSQHSG